MSLKCFKFPLTTKTELIRLEKYVLTNNKFKEEFITRLYNIGLRFKHLKRHIGQRIITEILHHKLLFNYSWTGVIKSNNRVKKPFNVYVGVIDSFYEAIYRLDQTHTEDKNIRLFSSRLQYVGKKIKRFFEFNFFLSFDLIKILLTFSDIMQVL